VLITLPKVVNDVLMFRASAAFRSSLIVPDFMIPSEPGRSTHINFAVDIAGIERVITQ
jgi:branched-subunit amino acid transport protein